MNPTFYRRRPTTRARHSTVGGRRLREWRHSTFNSRPAGVGCHPVVGCRLSNVVWYSFSDAAKVTFTTRESARTTQEVASKTNGVAPKTSEVAPKDVGVAPKGDEVAPKNAVKSSGDAVKESDAGLRENIIEKCAELYCFLRGDPGRTILTAVESLGFSPHSVAQYLNVLKDAHVLEHVGPTQVAPAQFFKVSVRLAEENL